GSGFWLGREAVRRLLTDLDRADAPGDLARQVLAELTGTTEVDDQPRVTAGAVVQAVTRRPPVELARLAPLVVSSARDGEPTAVVLITEAAALLAESVSRIRPSGATDPVVL
ncbi:ATPase, partial [Micromonospora aurantiaca]|nr:ATPase [Micromonospora aurantiaca]